MQTKVWLKKDDSEYLAVLRALSIFIIVVGHLGAFWIWRPWSEFLHVFVPIFFFISGAVSYNSFLKTEKKTSNYLQHRLVALLVPYYCMCIFSLLVFFFIFNALPPFDMGNLFRWITVIPSNAIMPFPLGQVWFLNTLIIIILASPALFWLYRCHFNAFLIYIFFTIALSLIQLQYGIGSHFIIIGQNFYRPIVHSLFFCLGFFVLDVPSLRARPVAWGAFLSFAGLSFFMVKALGLNPDYAFHIYHPDFYYVAGSISAIWAFLLFQSYLMRVYAVLPRIAHNTTQFFFRHTFSIFLLHTFSIFVVERVFWLVNPQQKTVSYALLKFGSVLPLTLILCPVFTAVSSSLSKMILRPLQHSLFQHTPSLITEGRCQKTKKRKNLYTTKRSNQ
jgi:peptidoglycan/LPS O-acetylase OafA/YrhL